MAVIAQVRRFWSALVRPEKEDWRLRSAGTRDARRGVARTLLLIISSFLVVSLSPELQAQTATGSIAGTVKDPSGAAVSGATIRLTNVATNEARNTQSNDLGYYAFPLTPPAAYKLEVEAHGFKRFIQENVKLDVGLAITLDAMRASFAYALFTMQPRIRFRQCNLWPLLSFGGYCEPAHAWAKVDIGTFLQSQFLSVKVEGLILIVDQNGYHGKLRDYFHVHQVSLSSV